LLQGYPNLEYIIIDGGSTDGNLEIIKKYEKFITYWISEPDNGQSEAINKGFAKSTGEIITFLSSDDAYVPDTLTDVAARFQTNPNVEGIVGAFQMQDENSKMVSDPIMPILARPAPLDMTLLEPNKYRLHQVSTFYRQAALEKVGFWVREDLHYVMDRELLYRICQGFPILLVNRVYGLFRKHVY